MWRNLFARGKRHFILLVPIGIGVGLAVGIVFDDVLFGLVVGTGFGIILGLLFTLQTH
jgi:hypothetical protein